MSQLILDPVLSGYNLAKVNDNFKRIEAAFNNLLLHKDGSKALTDDLDVNSQKLLNVGGIEIGGVDLLQSISQLQEEFYSYVTELENYKTVVDGILEEAISYGAVDKKAIGNSQRVFTTSQAYAKNATLTLPLRYIVGKNSMRLNIDHYYEFYLGKDYEEIGTIGQESTSIKILRNSGLAVGTVIEQWVDGDNDLYSIYATAQSLQSLLTNSYPPAKIQEFISSVSSIEALGIEDKIEELWSIYNNLTQLQVSFANTVADINTKYSTITDMYEDIGTRYNLLATLYPQLVELVANTDFDLDELDTAVGELLTAVGELQDLTETIETNAATASAAATTATTKASEASQSAVDASSYAQAASNSATAASDSASAASTSAATASTKASNAATSETNAANSASAAAASASAAAASAAEAQEIVDMYDEASEEAGRIVSSADQIVTDYQNSVADIAAMVEGSDEAIQARNLDIEHSAKTWAQLIEDGAEEFAGFQVSDYYKKTEINAALANKEDTISYDSTVTENSENVPTSGAVYTAIKTAIDNVEIDVDSTVTENGDNPVKSSGIYSYVANLITTTRTWVSTQISNALSSISNLSISGVLSLGHRIIMKDATNGDEQPVITVYTDGDSEHNYGLQMVIGAAGNTFIGGGESALSVYNAGVSSATAENMHVSADGIVYVISNCNTISERKVSSFNNDGTLTLNASPSASDSSKLAATTEYVKNNVPKSVGSGTKPVYTNANGVVTASGSNVGSVTRPICMVSGTLTQCTYTLGKSVPSDAVFTDHTYSNFVKSGSTAAAGLVPKPSTTAGTTKYLREDCTWQVPPNTTNFVKQDNGALAVGSYVIAATKATVNSGSTTAGSNLKPIGFDGYTSSSDYNYQTTQGSTLSGTWRNVSGVQLKTSTSGTFGDGAAGAGLWQRTA